MQQKFLILAVVFAFLLTACGQAKPNNENQDTSATLGEALSETQQIPDEQAENSNWEAEAFNWISADEVAKHNTVDDCWTIIHDQVFDISKAIAKHPGGEAILQGCGINATELFETRPMGSGTPHSEKAQENLDNFYLGDLAR